MSAHTLDSRPPAVGCGAARGPAHGGGTARDRRRAGHTVA